VPIFEGLTSDEEEALQAVVRSRRYGKGDFIFREGEQSEFLFVLHEGTVKISKSSDRGKEQIMRFLFPGDFFGQFALLQEKKHYANAEVLDSAVICSIHKQDFRGLLERNSTMAYRFLLAMSERLQQADEWMGTISLMEVDRRLAKLLLLFLEKNASQPKLRLPVPKKELASLLGTTPETLSRKLSALEEMGFIRMERRHLMICQPEQLSAYAAGS